MRRFQKAAGIGGAVAVLVGILAFVASRDASPERSPRATADHALAPTANPAPARGKAGPSLAVDPADGNHVVEVHQELVTASCEFNTSVDRGRTWVGGRLQGPDGYPAGTPGPCPVIRNTISSLGQQSVAFGSGGNVYVSWGGSVRPESHGLSVLLSRSSDGGASFSPAIEVPGLTGGVAPAPDFSRPEIVVDRRTPATDRIYITALNMVSGEAMVIRSDDAGATWDVPREASSSNAVRNPPPRFDGSTAVVPGDAYSAPAELTQPVLGPKPAGGGDRPIHVAWVGLGRGSRCPPACEIVGETEAHGYLVVATSLDAGRTWKTNRAVNVQGFRSPSGPTFRGSSFPRMAAGPDGSLYLVFNQGPSTPASASCGPGPFPAGSPGASTRPCPAYRDGAAFTSADHSLDYDTDVWFLRSTDGTTWDHLRQVNDGKRPGLAAAEVTQTRHPQVSVAANGRVDVVWEDRRHWYLSPWARISAVTPSATRFASPCVHTHAACEEARLGDTYYAASDDGGRTFTPNRRVNDRSHNNDIGFDHRVSTYRDYGPVAVALDDTSLLVADMDSRLGSSGTNSLDVFLRQVDLAPQEGSLPVDHLVTGGAASFSAAVSQRVQPGGSESVLTGEAETGPATGVVIVNEADPAAALAGGVLARARLGPLLASPSGGLPAAVKAEVDRLDPVRAYVVGDREELGPQVEVDLAAAGVPAERISRISGLTPADTAAAIARTLDTRDDAERAASPPVPAFDAAVIVNPDDPAAPAAAALAASRRLPVLHAGADGVPPATATALADLGIVRTLVVGAPERIGATVEAALPSPTRLAGGDPLALSRSVVEESVARGLPANVVYLADAAEPMHAALLGAAVARLGGILLLVPEGTTTKAESMLGDLRLGSVARLLVTSDLTGTGRATAVGGG